VSMDKAKRRKILVVDDEPTRVKLTGQNLSHRGYAVLTAGDGQEALRLLFANKPDLILLHVEVLSKWLAAENQT
jgi:CheY-like chemotaxis protein